MRFLPFLLGVLCLGGAVRADEVRLENGATLHAAIGPDREGESGLTLASPYGRLVLDRGGVALARREEPAEVEYRRRAPTISDTVESQHALAMWCRNNGLGDAMRRHLRRVLEIAPDHEEARALLGYQNVDGQWMTRDDVLAARGLVRWQGEYRTVQEVELLKRQEAAEQQQLEWRRRITGWRNDLDARDPEVVRAAAEAFDTLDDPAASQELIALLAKDPNAAVRRRLLPVLGRLGTGAGLAAMVDIALRDGDGELRALALEQLAADGRPGLAAPFVKALRSPNNLTVNRAGDALLVLGSRATIDPLIDALVTKHKRRVGNDSGGDTYSMNTASGTFGFGGGGPKVIAGEAQNPRVLAALVRLTGVNFLYDQAAWRDWLATQQKNAPVDLRRDA